MEPNTKKCSKCSGPVFRDRQRYCLVCHAEYMRAWRKAHEMSQEQRKKDNCRSYAGVYKRRGKLLQKPCEMCSDSNSQMHHDDYDKPLQVRWLCRKCHLGFHTGTLLTNYPDLCL